MKVSALTLAITILCSISIFAQAEELTTIETQNEFGRAIDITKAINTSTSMAVSPLGGMGLMGGYNYYTTPADSREMLPWYCKPFFWVPAALICLILLSKDILPLPVRSPLTAIKTVEDKFSALIAGLAVIPGMGSDLVTSQSHVTFNGSSPIPLAMIDANAVLIILPIFCFFAVWLVQHALENIMMFSPSGYLNIIINVVKYLFLAVFVGLAIINPYVGLALATIIVLISSLIAGWAFRWSVLGTLMSFDLLTLRFRKKIKEEENITCFSTKRVEDVKPRTYGKLIRSGNELIFSWKPWLVMPVQEKRFDLDSAHKTIEKGLLCPSVKHEDDKIFRLRLRFRGHEKTVNQILDLNGVEPCAVVKGLKSAVAWAKNQMAAGRNTAKSLVPKRKQQITSK